MIEATTVSILVLLLAWANGANDIPKGIATLVGSGVGNPLRAVAWGTLCTVAGGLTALAWGGELVNTFSALFTAVDPASGRGIVAASLCGATAWVALATRLGLPVSTTHALLGGIAGAALTGVGGSDLHGAELAKKVLVPLLLSPLIAVAACWALLRAARLVAAHVPAWKPGCCEHDAWRKNPYACADDGRTGAGNLPGAPSLSMARQDFPVPLAPFGHGAYSACGFAFGRPRPPCGPANSAGPQWLYASRGSATADYAPSLRSPWRAANERLWRALHWLSSGATSFARGLNDVPKIAVFLIIATALLPVGTGLSGAATGPIVAVTLVMALGGVWGSRKVLHVLAHRVARLEPGSGLVANVGTSFLVLAATPLGLPVSTTHISTGALMGVRWTDRSLPREADALKGIVLGWIVTLPAAAAVSAIAMQGFKSF